MQFPFSIIVNSEDETADVARSFSKVVNDGSIIALNGNLGAGKTFFVKKFCEINNFAHADSPTFSILNEYRGVKLFYHFDFYRINKIEELYDIGIDEYLNDDNAIIFIEWAEMMPEILPSKFYEVKIEFISDNSRKIDILKHE